MLKIYHLQMKTRSSSSCTRAGQSVSVCMCFHPFCCLKDPRCPASHCVLLCWILLILEVAFLWCVVQQKICDVWYSERSAAVLWFCISKTTEQMVSIFLYLDEFLHNFLDIRNIWRPFLVYSSWKWIFRNELLIVPKSRLYMWKPDLGYEHLLFKG